jgi:siroheme synthase
MRERTGTVVLVGAGPRDPTLLTLEAREALSSAAGVFCDYVVRPDTLRSARFGAQLPYVGEHRTSGERFSKQGVSTWLSSNRLQVRMMQAIKFEPKR